MNRSGNVDLIRFISAILIMACHMPRGPLSGPLPFDDAWIFVELFLLITGYYSAKHFDGLKSNNPFKDTIMYTGRKWLYIIPFSCAITVLGYCTQILIGLFIQDWTWKQVFNSLLSDLPFDALLLTSSYGYPLIAPLWYASALIIVFPLFCLCIQIKNKYLISLICFYVPLMYYGWTGASGERAFPHDLFRALSGMMLGALLYEISITGKALLISKSKAILTIVEVTTIVFIIWCCYNNYSAEGIISTRSYILLFCVFALICLPGTSYTSKIRGPPVASFLGRLSLPLFTVHWWVATICNLFGDKFGWETAHRVVTYYCVALLLSTVLLIMVERDKRLMQLKTILDSLG